MVLVETALHSRNLDSEHKIAAIEHQSHDCTVHDNELGAEPVHSFLLSVPSSSYVRVKDKVEGSQQPCSTLERQCSANAKRRSLSANSNDVNNDPYGDEIERLFEQSPLLSEEELELGVESVTRNYTHDHSHQHGHQHEHSHHQHGHRHSHQHAASPSLNHPEEQKEVDDYLTFDHSHGHSHGGAHLRKPLDTSSSSRSGSLGGSSKGSGRTTTAAASSSLWLALVVHSLMEGFGIGVTSNPLKQTTLVLAVLIHKGFASLALASALLESGMEYNTFLTFFLTFACASPLGAVLASVVQAEGGSSVLSGVVTGLASGSFMYIGFMEMLPAMLTSCQHMTDAMLLFVFSAVAMAALAGVV
jgi:zinc transporter ZupT